MTVGWDAKQSSTTARLSHLNGYEVAMLAEEVHCECTSGWIISSRLFGGAALAYPIASRGDRVVVHAVIRGHQLVDIMSVHLLMLAHRAAGLTALEIDARACATLQELACNPEPPVNAF